MNISSTQYAKIEIEEKIDGQALLKIFKDPSSDIGTSPIEYKELSSLLLAILDEKEKDKKD